MQLPLTEATAATLIWHDESPSTNAALRDLVRDVPRPAELGALDGTLIATANQTAGRGRLDRGWVMPPGEGLAISLLVQTPQAIRRDGLAATWLPLLTGVAVARTLQPFFVQRHQDLGVDGSDDTRDESEEVSHGTSRVGVKWPNDVHVRSEDDAVAGKLGGKLCGILCELLDEHTAIVGVGFNVLINESELPTERATSLRAAGANLGEAMNVQSLTEPRGMALVDELLSSYVRELRAMIRLAANHPDQARASVARASFTLGTEVRAHLPGGERLDGRAVALATDGALVIEHPLGGRVTLAAGDIEHLRER